MIEGTIAGTGVALDRLVRIADDLREGRLFWPFGHATVSRFRYWFEQDVATIEIAAHRTFFNWKKVALDPVAHALVQPANAASGPLKEHKLSISEATFA